MYPIIFLWAHPRSVSTATERVMRERGDLQCLHEPFLHYYYLQKTGRKLPLFDSEQNHPESYEATRDLILGKAEISPVFAKDMSYYVMPELLEDREFCAQITHCFLIRHPRKSILSYYRLDPDFSCEEVGLASQWQHFQGIEKMGLTKPVVLEAEAIQSDTKSAMKLFWKALGLDYKEKAFEWSSESTPQDWQYVKGWHEQVGGSTGINSAKPSDDSKAREDFERAVELAPQLKEYLEFHLPCYQALKQHSLTPVS